MEEYKFNDYLFVVNFFAFLTFLLVIHIPFLAKLLVGYCYCLIKQTVYNMQVDIEIDPTTITLVITLWIQLPL